MKVALFSPVNPVKSGISDYTEEMLPHLSRRFDIDLYVEKGVVPSTPGLEDHCRVRTFDPHTFNSGAYHHILYHMGNSYRPHRYIHRALMKYPGVVVLHDYVLAGFYAERYDAGGDRHALRSLLQRLYPGEGERIAQEIVERHPVPVWETPSGLDFPMNEEVIRCSRGILVHSAFLRDRIQRSHSLPVGLIPHHGHERRDFDDSKTRQELGVAPEDILVCSAGYVNKNKRFQASLSALSGWTGEGLVYLIAGSDPSRLLPRICRGFPPRGVIHRKGYLPLKEIERFISASDICINLRYPTMGETSGILLRMMGYGKPVLVTRCGSYAEMPDSAVVKINPDVYEKDMIRAFVRALSENRTLRRGIGARAREYVDRHCDTGKCAEKTLEFLESIPASLPGRE